MIVLLHCLNLIKSVLIRVLDSLKGSSAASKNGTAHCEDSREILSGQHLEISVNQTSVTIEEAVYLYILTAVKQ